MAKPKVETKIKDMGFKRIRKELEKLENQPFVKIGWPEESKKSGEKHKGASPEVTNLFLAVIHEFGTADGSIPERAPLRKTFDEQSRKWEKMTLKLARDIYAGKATVEKSLDILGEVILADVKKMVASGLEPSLAPSTLARRALKGDSNPTPLIDTSQMINSLLAKKIMNGKGRVKGVST